jgi:hypothetical protein
MKFVSIMVYFTLSLSFRCTSLALTKEKHSSNQGNSTAELRELLQFYTHEEFPSNLWMELHAQTLLSDAEITTDGLKDIFPDKCDMLIDQIATTVRREVPEVLLDGPRDIRAACPQWDRLSENDRKDFYVALITSMALTESSCNNRAKNKNAPSGTAYGLWQSPNPLSPAKGARWVLDQIESQVNKSGLLFWSNKRLNYWAVLNPGIHAHKVKRILRKIPACVIKALAKN